MRGARAGTANTLVGVQQSRPQGTITRGTTNPNRLLRMDRWFNRRAESLLRHTRAPLAVDLGFGGSGITTAQWRDRLAEVAGDVRVVGLEIDPARVAAAAPFVRPGRLEFAVGGFELAGLRPLLLRAANVLRQYEESQVDAAWRLMCDRLAPGGLLLEGTCDELGRIAGWVLLDAGGPRSLTLAADVARLERPAVLAERLPKALIHRNVPGEPIHALITAMDDAWRDCAASTVFGARDRWRRTLDTLTAAGWPIAEPPARRRDGTLTVPWSTVAPRLPGVPTRSIMDRSPVRGSRTDRRRRYSEMADPSQAPR